jgi:hypothetical protein
MERLRASLAQTASKSAGRKPKAKTAKRGATTRKRAGRRHAA